MKDLSGFFISTLVLAFVCSITVLDGADIAKQGTMVVAVRFREGLVVCADKRSHLDGADLPKGNYRDDDIKITLVTKSGGFVTAGVPILERTDGVRVFDADRLLSDYFDKQGFTKFDRLAEHVESAFRNYVLSKQPGERPPTLWPDGQPVFFRAMIFFVVSKGVDLYDLELRYLNADPPEIHAAIQNRSQDRLRIYGTAVLKEIMGGVDPRFADLRRDSVFASVLRAGWASQITESQAVAFAKRAIAVTGERVRVLDETLVTSFGPTSDCALTRNGKNVEWRPHGD